MGKLLKIEEDTVAKWGSEVCLTALYVVLLLRSSIYKEKQILNNILFHLF